jgi:branched-chain amino acid transport system substrate-binding protein
MAQTPKPKTVAIAAADAEFGRSDCGGARDNAKKSELNIVYDKSDPSPSSRTSSATICRSSATQSTR